MPDQPQTLTELRAALALEAMAHDDGSCSLAIHAAQWSDDQIELCAQGLSQALTGRIVLGIGDQAETTPAKVFDRIAHTLRFIRVLQAGVAIQQKRERDAALAALAASPITPNPLTAPTGQRVTPPAPRPNPPQAPGIAITIPMPEPVPVCEIVF